MLKATQAAESARALLALGDADGACNRAYYAMFDAARAALRVAGHDVGKTHRGVLNAFNDHLVKDGPIPKETGRLLKHAEAFRYVADYSDDAVDLADARTMVEQAESFVMAVRSILERPGRAE
ncbi:MAG: HEPN domain-containing protein [Rhodospirillales bacterium]|nr:HEPN domain-containing protein [Rhodospirillales bacterium]